MDESRIPPKTRQISIPKPITKPVTESLAMPETKPRIKPTSRQRQNSATRGTSKSGNDAYRSAYRSSYRAVINHKEYTKKNYKETFIIQSIACGIILCVVLFSTVIHTPFAKSLNENLTALINDGAMPIDGEYGFFEGMKNSVKGIFAEGSDEPNVSTVNAVDTTNGEDFRIDEDILEEMNSEQDFYGEPVKKKEVPKEQSQIQPPTEQEMGNQPPM